MEEASSANSEALRLTEERQSASAAGADDDTGAPVQSAKAYGTVATHQPQDNLPAMEPPLLWLRAESRADEARTPLTPAQVAQLCAAGWRVVTERCAQRAFRDEDYAAAGSRLRPAGSWRAAPTETCVIGLKELPEDGQSLAQRHIYFAHAYKGQSGWRALLRRFREGGGELLDLEYLVDDAGRRLAAFGYWAGFVGAALAVAAWCGQQRGKSPPLDALEPWRDRQALVAWVSAELEAVRGTLPRQPRSILIGAGGRVGSGARELLGELGLPATAWDLPETAAGGPFAQVTAHEIFLNCVLVSEPLPPFVTRESVSLPGRRLSVIADISCDPHGDYNPVPLYDEPTTLHAPSRRLLAAEPPLDLVAIDNLPALLPREASEDFGRQLLPCLLRLTDPDDPVWQRCRQLFHSMAGQA
jgi:saccharopine dehydrogenase (NAD+, L-lysine-forming)